MAKSQQTKKCSKCSETKLTSEFNKSSISRLGVQNYCRECCKINNARKEVIEKRYEYNRDYMKGDKNGIIYTITNPLGECYVGSTQRLPNLRWNSHKTSYKNLHGSFPELHQSFDTWGIDSHEFKVIDIYENINKIELRDIETNMIKAYKLNGKSLNVNN
jgi:hypothetical protein